MTSPSSHLAEPTFGTSLARKVLEVADVLLMVMRADDARRRSRGQACSSGAQACSGRNEARQRRARLLSICVLKAEMQRAVSSNGEKFQGGVRGRKTSELILVKCTATYALIYAPFIY